MISFHYQYEFTVNMENSVDPDQLELIWISTIFKRGYMYVHSAVVRSNTARDDCLVLFYLRLSKADPEGGHWVRTPPPPPL